MTNEPDEGKLKKVLATLTVEELETVRDSGWVTEAAGLIINEEIAGRSPQTEEREDRAVSAEPAQETIFDYLKWKPGSSVRQNCLKRLITLSVSSVVLSILQTMQDIRHSASDVFYIFGFTLGIMGIAGIAFVVLALVFSLLFQRKFSVKFYTNLYTAAWVLTCFAVYFGDSGPKTVQ